MKWIGRKREPVKSNVRSSTLELLAYEISENQVPGNVAELGVHQGYFARDINICFKNRKLYLFDTFEGFDIRDTDIEHRENFSNAVPNQRFSDTSIEVVQKNMLYPQNCIFKKGWFPDTAKEIDDTFSFVSLDCDLYSPTLSGLEFFYPLLNKGGFIMIHDYNMPGYKGVKKAVKEFCLKNNISYVPVCDFAGSVILTK